MRYIGPIFYIVDRSPIGRAFLGARFREQFLECGANDSKGGGPRFPSRPGVSMVMRRTRIAPIGPCSNPYRLYRIPLYVAHPRDSSAFVRSGQQIRYRRAMVESPSCGPATAASPETKWRLSKIDLGRPSYTFEPRPLVVSPLYRAHIRRLSHPPRGVKMR